MRAKNQNFFVRENELFLRISEYSIFFNAFKGKVDWNGLQKSHLEFSCDFGEESVYVRGLWSILAIFLCIATAALICGQMMTPPLKLLRKRNQHQISVINHLFIYSFSVLCLTNITLGLHLQSLLEARKDIYICTMNTFCQPPYSILTG